MIYELPDGRRGYEECPLCCSSEFRHLGNLRFQCSRCGINGSVIDTDQENLALFVPDDQSVKPIFVSFLTKKELYV